MQPETPGDFSSPHEKEIIQLEQQYSRALANGEVFEVLKVIRTRIKLLKSELGSQREKIINITTDKLFQ